MSIRSIDDILPCDHRWLPDGTCRYCGGRQPKEKASVPGAPPSHSEYMRQRRLQHAIRVTDGRTN